jgi:hypothetical protein
MKASVERKLGRQACPFKGSIEGRAAVGHHLPSYLKRARRQRSSTDADFSSDSVHYAP